MRHFTAVPLSAPIAVYESEEYYRASVEPQLEDGSSIPADVYIWKDQYKWVTCGSVSALPAYGTF